MKTLAVVIGAYLLAVVTGLMPLSWPVDVALNLGSAPLRADLAAPNGQPRPLVVLQHGFYRSGWSLWKLERALEAHGYDVLNPSYPSRSATLQNHAATLADHVRAALAERDRPPLVYFVGHSMGGLVIRRYLSRPDAVSAAGVVFLGTPQRGAILADVHYRSWITRLVIGDKAGKQLVPGNPFYAELRSLRAPAGTIIGSRGDADGYDARIPGDDDRRVSIKEARLPGAEAIVLPLGHTALTTRDEVIEQVLHFLRHRRFE